MRTIRPLYDKLLVRRLREDEAPPLTPSNLLVAPEVAKEKPAEGDVLAAGDGRLMPDGTLVPLRVAAGDRVLFGKFSGTEVNLGTGEDLLILREDEVLAVVDPPPAYVDETPAAPACGEAPPIAPAP